MSALRAPSVCKVAVRALLTLYAWLEWGCLSPLEEVQYKDVAQGVQPGKNTLIPLLRVRGGKDLKNKAGFKVG